MKLLNIFKKESSKHSDSKKVTIQKLEKKQLEKVIGGDGEEALYKRKSGAIQQADF